MDPPWNIVIASTSGRPLPAFRDILERLEIDSIRARIVSGWREILVEQTDAYSVKVFWEMAIIAI